MSYEKKKRSLSSHKGHYGIVYKSFTTLVNQDPPPSLEAVGKSYAKLQDRYDKIYTALDICTSTLDNDDSVDDDAKEKEQKELIGYHEVLLTEQNSAETLYSVFKAANVDTSSVPRQPPPPPIVSRPTVKLTALSPPKWKGVKADFYTWKTKFQHIMSEANVHDEMTQLCYLQSPSVLPEEFQLLISDCSSMSEVWSRLEERLPKSTIRHEVVARLRNVSPLLAKRSVASLRDFANEISLFCRRMADLDYTKDNYTCIILQDVYERLDRGTALRYRNKIDLQRSLGGTVEEDLESLSSFLRSEATTLEMTMGVSSVNVSSVSSADSHALKGNVETKCDCGCESVHQMADCRVFIGMTSDKRHELVKSSLRCFRCLGKAHFIRNCTSTVKCSACEGKHHVLLCTKATDTTSAPEKKSSCCVRANVNPRDYSPLVIAEVKNKSGEWVRAKCFLDNGSNASLARRDFAIERGLQTGGEGEVHLEVAGGSVHTEPSEEFEFHIRPVGGVESYFMVTSGITKPCADVRSLPKSVFSTYEHLKPVQNHVYLDGGEVDILVGRDYAPLISEESVLRATVNPDDSPSVAFTRLGCHLFGGLTKGGEKAPKSTNAIFMNKEDETELKRFLYGDVLGVQPTSLCVCTDNEISESKFIKHVRETTSMNEEGRVNVEMAWAQGYPQLLPSPNNFFRAKDQMVRREAALERDGNLAIHNHEIQMLVDSGAVIKLSLEDSLKTIQETGWFLNHRLIERPDKSSTKYRLVFDSAAPYKGVCLNDGYEKGPSLTNPLFKCLLKWREGYVAATGDIEKMFTQVGIAEKDRKYHRFIWREGDSQSPIYVYQWQRLLFGNKPSPDLATYALHYLADKERCHHPGGAYILENEAYVDDIGFSEDDATTTAENIAGVDSILRKGRFNVKVWNSNDPELDQNKNEEIVDVLGHKWSKRDDTFTLKPKPIEAVSDENMTKKWALGCVARCWDPLGIHLPVSIQYRIDLQKLWEKGFGWEQALPQEIVERWIAHTLEMQQLHDVMLNRCLKPPDVIDHPQLHVFSDGGGDAYGTCIFIRWVTSKGIELRFVAAKAFVAPLKRKSTPRVELMGAIAMSRLTTEVVKALGYYFKFKRFWIDSEVVLYWLFSESCRHKPFVSTRVQEFQDTHPSWKEELRYVPSKDNSADCLTKSIPVDRLQDWYAGQFSEFLKEDESVWDLNVDPNSLDEEAMKDVLEIKTSGRGGRKLVRHGRKKVASAACAEAVELATVEELKSFGRDLASQYSNWQRMVFAVAFMVKSLKNSSFGDFSLSPSNVAQAEKCIFRLCQEDLRSNVKGTAQRFVKYLPFLDTQNILRAKGRLQNIRIDEELKHPIILPSEHALVYLFLQHYHRKLLHQGYRVIVANMMNDGYLVVGAKECLKSIASKCFFCRTRRRKLMQQMMGDLPSFRIQPRTPPFTSAAMDFFGPLKVKLTRNCNVDGSVLIVTCTTTRCVHLELSLMDTTDSFLQAWRRFVTLRGVHPAHVFSDGGPNFKGAKPLIREWITMWDQQLLQQQFPTTDFDFAWKTNIPTASHMNGVVESLIASVRKGLDACITNYTRRILTFEHWSTVLAEVGYVINSRPLFPDGDPWDFHCITANDILHPYGQPNLPQYTVEHEGTVREMFKAVQVRVDVFWDAWMRHMPPQLLPRNKWFHPRANIEVGDFVIVFEQGFKGKSAPRATWMKAIVTAVHPSADGLVRSVTIRDSKHNEYKRPIHKLCLIATRAELEADEV